MKVYSIEDVVRMLPLLRSYSKSLTQYARWVADTFTRHMGQEELDDLLLQNWEKLEAFEQEFATGDPECKICHCRRGCVDMAVIHPHLNEVVHICVDTKTMEETDLKAHRGFETDRDRKGIWEHEVENCE